MRPPGPSGGAFKIHLLPGDGSPGFIGLGALSLPGFAFGHSPVGVPLAV